MAIAVYIFLVLLLVGGVVLVARSSRSGHGHPACGGCGYDLTGSISPGVERPVTRCPECGAPFIAAGIVPAGRTSRPWLGVLGLVMILVAIGLFSAGLFASSRPVTRQQILITPMPNAAPVAPALTPETEPDSDE